MNRPRSIFRDRHRGPVLYLGPAGPPPKYLAASLELAKQIGPGEFRQVNVYHDDDCGVFRGRPCDCNPEVKLAPEPERN